MCQNQCMLRRNVSIDFYLKKGIQKRKYKGIVFKTFYNLKNQLFVKAHELRLKNDMFDRTQRAPPYFIYIFRNTWWMFYV